MISLSSLATGKEKERERGNGVTDFTVVSSILDTFFFNGKGERDYQTSGYETSVPDPNTFWATEGELLIPKLEPRFRSPSLGASCIGLLLYWLAQLPGSGTQVTKAIAGMWASSSPRSHPQVPPLTLAAAIQLFVSDEVSEERKAVVDTVDHPIHFLLTSSFLCFMIFHQLGIYHLLQVIWIVLSPPPPRRRR